MIFLKSFKRGQRLYWGLCHPKWVFFWSPPLPRPFRSGEHRSLNHTVLGNLGRCTSGTREIMGWEVLKAQPSGNTFQYYHATIDNWGFSIVSVNSLPELFYVSFLCLFYVSSHSEFILVDSACYGSIYLSGCWQVTTVHVSQLLESLCLLPSFPYCFSFFLFPTEWRKSCLFSLVWDNFVTCNFPPSQWCAGPSL